MIKSRVLTYLNRGLDTKIATFMEGLKLGSL